MLNILAIFLAISFLLVVIFLNFWLRFLVHIRCMLIIL